jgi:glycosyltransferase involved in cell wall biosynthesis
MHTHTSKAGFLGRLAGRIRQIPIIVHTPHGHVFHSYFSPWKEQFFLFLERWSACWSHGLIALTDTCRREHLELGVGEASQWEVIASGINEKDFMGPEPERGPILNSLKIPAGKKLIGFVGRLAPIKGPQFLVEALALIRRSVPNIHCLFVGDGEEKTFLERRVDQLGLKDSVTFSGHQSEVSKYFSILDVLVVPSLNEGMGRVIAEAGLLGKAVVATRVGGIPDLIEDGKTGVLVERRSPKEIAQAVVSLLQDPVRAEQMGSALRGKVVQGFTERQMVDKIDAFYQKLLKEKGIKVPTFRGGLREAQHLSETTLSGHRAPSG